MSDALPPVCILAGGLGTRLGERAKTVPKPLVEVAGQPFLLHQLAQLAAQGVTRVVLLVGHLGAQVEETIGGARYGLMITYSYDAPGLDGTLGAIRRATPLLDERFLVLYGDTYLQIDYQAIAKSWAESGLKACMAVLHNEGRWGPSNAIYADHRILHYDKFSPSPDMTWIDYGLGGLTAGCLDAVDIVSNDLADLYHSLAEDGQLFGYVADERFYEIGSPAALEETELFLREHRPMSGPAGAR